MTQRRVKTDQNRNWKQIRALKLMVWRQGRNLTRSKSHCAASSESDERETDGSRQAEVLLSYYTPAVADEEVALQPRKSRAKTCKRKLKL